MAVGNSTLCRTSVNDLGILSCLSALHTELWISFAWNAFIYSLDETVLLVKNSSMHTFFVVNFKNIKVKMMYLEMQKDESIQI